MKTVSYKLEFLSFGGAGGGGGGGSGIVSIHLNQLSLKYTRSIVLSDDWCMCEVNILLIQS